MLVWGDQFSLGHPMVSDHVWEPELFAIREVFLDLEPLTVVLGQIKLISKKLLSTNFKLDLLLCDAGAGTLQIVFILGELGPF